MRIMVYVIEQAWADGLENEIDSAFGYEPCGYVTSEAQAKRICSASKVLDKSFCWAVQEGFGYKRLRYTAVPEYVLRRAAKK